MGEIEVDLGVMNSFSAPRVDTRQLLWCTFKAKGCIFCVPKVGLLRHFLLCKKVVQNCGLSFLLQLVRTVCTLAIYERCTHVCAYVQGEAKSLEKEVSRIPPHPVHTLVLSCPRPSESL